MRFQAALIDLPAGENVRRVARHGSGGEFRNKREP
jgi:hypothetical protein